ncbi:MAG: hypothetical protein WB810_03625 [Candidatus Cybelea sp.]
MRLSIRFGSLLVVGLSLPSCAGASYTASRNATPWVALVAGHSFTSARAHALTPLRKRRRSEEFVSDAETGDVAQCKGKTCSLCITPGSGPQGVTTGPVIAGDQVLSGYVYVAVTLASEILVLRPAASGVSCSILRTLDDPGEYPSDVAVRSDGMVAVTNICSAPSCGPGNIAFYAPGATYPTSTVTGLLSRFYFGDFDKAGNFYNDGVTANSATAVGVVPAGATSDMPTGISGIGSPGGVQVARNGTINIDDQDCPCIQIYKGNSHVGTVALPGVVDPASFALNKRNNDLWVADAASGKVDEVRYPAGGSIIATLGGFSQPIGVGVIPPDNP